MSVMVMLRLKADVEKFEQYAAEHGDQFTRIAEDGKSRGALATCSRPATARSSWSTSGPTRGRASTTSSPARRRSPS